MEHPRRRLIHLVVVLAVASIAAFMLGCGGGDEKSGDDAQTVSFQEPDDPGPDPFTEPSDEEGDETVPVSSNQPSGDTDGEQPFGGSGSNRVCNRDKLIRFLKANPERMREWAEVLGVSPTFSAVKEYIAKLHPVTLTRDTRITNHAFRDGHAVPFQAILKAGTAVLVDKYGAPVVRCYCGNPLKPAVFTKTAKCTGCPPNYKPPQQCKYGHFDDYDDVYYRRSFYSNQGYDEVFIKRHSRSRYGKCYTIYPDPPVVTVYSVYRRTEEPSEPEPAPATTPEPEPEPSSPPRETQPTPQPTTPTPPPAQTTPTPPAETTPDICNDGQDNEGEPGLVDGEDPNCQ